MVPAADPVRAPARKKGLVFVRRGLGSAANDGVFDDLAASLSGDGYDVRRLGDDPDFPYDTFGSIDANARVLTDQVRRVSADYSGIDILTHSMGGVVVDRGWGRTTARSSSKSMTESAGPIATARASGLLIVPLLRSTQ
jgi:hypothetical protein